jgi:predicted nuclease with TOPRIM domain
MEDNMADEATASTPAQGTPSTAGNMNQGSKSESEVIRELKDTLTQLAKRVDEQKSFFDRQANEIGELRKKTNVEAVKVETKTPDVTQVATPAEFEFDKLAPSEKDTITVYMRDYLSKLHDAEKKLEKDALRDKANFNTLAKEVHEKLKTPKYIEDVLGNDPVVNKAKSQSVEIMDAIRAELKLVDIEKNATPPSGGSSRGTVIPSKDAKDNKPRKFPNGGVISMTQ